MEEESYSSGFDTRSVKRYTDTPLTFNLVAARIAKFDGSENKKESAHWMKMLQSKVAPRFALAMKTLDDWANHRPVTQVTATKSVTGSFPNLFNQNQMLSSIISASAISGIKMDLSALSKSRFYYLKNMNWRKIIAEQSSTRFEERRCCLLAR